MKFPVLAAPLVAALAFAQAPSGSLTQGERSFVDRAAQFNMLEANIGKLAQQNAQSQDLKQLGQAMEQEHTQAYQRLQSIAQGAGYSAPTGLNPQNQATAKRLSGLTGAEFDNTFKSIAEQENQQAATWLQGSYALMKNQDLKTLSSELLAMAQKNLGTLNGPGNQTQTQTGAAGVVAGAPSSGAAPQGEPQNQPQNQPAGVSPTQPGAQQPGTAQGGQPNGPTVTPSQETIYGTVTAVQPGKSFEVKVRGRVGRYTYDLSELQAGGADAGSLKVGDQVSITESIDQNGRQSIQVKKDATGRYPGY